MADSDGWKRGQGAYSKNNGGLTTKQPYEQTAGRRDISTKYGNEFTASKGCDPWSEPTWAPAAFPRDRNQGAVAPGVRDRQGDFGTSPNIKAASPTGKYAKKGGSGQRSGV